MAIATIVLPKGGAKSPSPAVLRKVRSAMRRDGAVRLANLFPPDLLKKVRAAVYRRHESGELRERGLIRDIAGRYAALLPFEGPFLDPKFYANPALTSIIESLLGSGYVIGSLETVIALPGAGRQHQHIDGPIRFDLAAGKTRRRYRGDLSDIPPYAVTLCVPLCDVDESNGPTAIWPGSHRASLRAEPPGEREIARKFPVEHMTGDFGGTFIFDYRTFHGGTPNQTSEPRPVLMFVFTRSWFRDPNLNEVYPRVVISRRDLARVPERHKPMFLLGQASRRPLWAPPKKSPKK